MREGGGADNEWKMRWYDFQKCYQDPSFQTKKKLTARIT